MGLVQAQREARLTNRPDGCRAHFSGLVPFAPTSLRRPLIPDGTPRPPQRDLGGRPPTDPAGREQVRRAARGGRPSLDPGTPGETSPQWQVRAPRSLDTAMRTQARAEGRSLSELVRDAASQYLAAHAS